VESSVSVQPGPEQQDAPLSEEERKLLTRLFSDPTYFPLEFRTWIKNYIETSGISLPASAIIGGAGKIVNLPIGSLLAAAGNLTAPNVLPCDGRSLLRTDFPKLFTAIGVVWGSAGGTFFNLPDFRDRALYGVGTFVTLGATDGVSAGSRGGPRHSHTFAQTSGSAGAHGHNVSGTTDGGGSHTHDTNDYTGFNFNLITGTAGDMRSYLEPRGKGMTYSGSHGHNVGGSTDVQGSHTHAVSGATSGGFLADRPSYAGVNVYIVTDT
jgi:microcystin-dependent protein